MLIRSITLIVFLLLSSKATFSHDCNSATIEIKRLAVNQWIMSLMSPLYGLDKCMRAYNAKKSVDLTSLVVGSPKYKEPMVEYIKSEFSLITMTKGRGNKVSEPVEAALGKGRLKLNDHSSTFIFEIRGLTNEFEQIVARFAYMADNKKQSTLLKLVDESKTKRYMLNVENDFSIVDSEFFKNATSTVK